MIRKGLLDKIFEAASITRWNDHVRPVELTEIDKQAHKMIIAWVLAKFEETRREAAVDWVGLIEGGVFELLQRIVLTDIKPPVFHRLMANKGPEVNRWVLEALGPDTREVAGGFQERFERYLMEPAYSQGEKRLLRAAHYLATNWEFKIIYNCAPFIYGIEATKAAIENEIEDHYDLIGVQKISLGKKSYGFVDLCGQLRFQQRWAQTPRIPKTSVLGHMLMVAIFSYLFSTESGVCRKRVYNNFFGGLFHDLPEVLTRDIVSPVKKGIEGLGAILKEYEILQLRERILPLLPTEWHDEIRYWVEDEFSNKIVRDGAVLTGLSREQMREEFDDDALSPVDGELIQACDHLAAFVEASYSIAHGVKSAKLEEGKRQLYEMYRGANVVGVSLGPIFDYYN